MLFSPLPLVCMAVLEREDGRAPCEVKMVNSTSRSRQLSSCQHGVSFKCEISEANGQAAVWVAADCQGKFACNGQMITCAIPAKARSLGIPSWMCSCEPDERLRRTANERWMGLLRERNYWRKMTASGWVFSAKADFSKDLVDRLNRSKPFIFEREMLAHSHSHQTLFRALDVGAGPISAAGWRLSNPRHAFELQATDPLAREYNVILDEYRGMHPLPGGQLGLAAPVRALTVEGERLTEVFARDSFDLVMSRNAIDHARDPLLALSEMLAVVKPGRPVMLQVYENEARMQGASGLHRWNFVWESPEQPPGGPSHRLILSGPYKHRYSAKTARPPAFNVQQHLNRTLESLYCRRGQGQGDTSAGHREPIRAITCQLLKRAASA